MTDRPAWFLDVDGVVNAVTHRGKQPPRAAGWTDWIDTTVAGFRIVAAVPVLDFLRRTHHTGAADIRWLTTWEHQDAVLTDLAPALDLPAWPIAGRPPEDGPLAVLWWKYPHVTTWARQHPGQRIIWTDDELSRERTAKLWAQQSDHVLPISPNPGTGLMPTHLDKITRFLQQPAPPTDPDPSYRRLDTQEA